jgi:hypothetical protein
MKHRGRKSRAELALVGFEPAGYSPPPPDPPPPPDHLGQPERELWGHFFREYQLEGIIAETFVEMALCAHMQARTCGERIRADGGPVIAGRYGQPKAHPLLSAERRAWATYFVALKALKLER